MIVAPRDLDDFAAHRHGLVIGQGRGHLGQLQSQQPAHRHGRDCSGHMVASPHRQAETQLSGTIATVVGPAGDDAETQPAAHAADVHRPQVALAAAADPGDAHRAIGGQGAQSGVVGQHGVSVGRQRGQQLGLGPRDVVAAAETGQMGIANRRDHADLGPAEGGQGGNLARTIGPQLQHGIVVLRLHRRHAQGDAEVVVEVARAGRARQPRLQHRVDHLPRGGLAHAAGHGDDRAGELPAFPGGPLPQRAVVSSTSTAHRPGGTSLAARRTAPAAPRRNASPTKSPPS